MKIQLIFYLVWDVIFYFYLYIMCSIENSAHEAYFKMAGSPLLFIVAPSLLRIIPGVLMGWLVFVTMKHEVSTKSAVLEFVIVGGLAFYLAMLQISYFIVPTVFEGYLPHFWPRWLLIDRNMTTITMGSVLFGYELLMFIIRMVSCRKELKLSEPKQENI